MPTHLEVTGPTNPTPDTRVDLRCDCHAIWTLAQQFVMRQIVTHAPVCEAMPDYREGDPRIVNKQLDKSPPEFVSNFAVRARRIAAAYAAVYLEDFHLGKKDQIGRFYWLGLGAFAAKQVAVTLEWPLLQSTKFTTTYKLLGQGNLWLFNDVLPWFYGYAAGADTFATCAKERHSDKFMEPTKKSFRRQLDYETVIAHTPMERDGKTGAVIDDHLGYLQCTPLVAQGFAKVTDWEKADSRGRPKAAFQHLLLIAQHEQGEVLQGLIYDNAIFQAGLDLQSALLSKKPTDNPVMAVAMGPVGITAFELSILAHATIPGLQLVLRAEDNTSNMDYRSDAPDGIVLQNYLERMRWITNAAGKYDKLMRNRTAEMHAHLTTIASFGDLADTP
ncbi:DUF2515 family protein [Paraburkholderia flava]|uniref:DUF2515 family protein n=1 Tax=Paraburkholderia flava TaxID=2547393 RepID=UPI00105C7CD5|nr:hypothetical protein [Paraburkholderia flava]